MIAKVYNSYGYKVNILIIYSILPSIFLLFYPFFKYINTYLYSCLKIKY